MLTSKLQETLNKKWQHCWPVSDLRPLALLDLISYLFFIKKADDLELIHQMIKSSRIDNFIYSRETEDFTWSSLQNLNTSKIHQLFTKENGLIGLMNHYGKTNAAYSNYFKAPLLIEPTPKLLSNAIEIVNIIETNDQLTRENIIEYLYTKFRNNGKNEQAFLPEPILKLIISLAEPLQEDTIFDPAAGNGNLLLSAFRHIQTNNSYLAAPAIYQNTEIKISGCEPDGVHLRIAAMNMEIHGMASNIYVKSLNQTTKENPSLIISSLALPNDTVATPENDNSSFAESEAAILNNITESLGSKGRAVVLVQKNLLQSELLEIINSRKKLVDQNDLRAVITLESKNDSLFAGAAILVFYKSEDTSGDIWFYKWRSSKKKNNKTASNAENSNPEFEEVADILDKWKSRNEQIGISTPNSFFISANYIRSNNYKLSFNDYKLAKQQQLQEQKNDRLISEPTETLIVTKKENLHEFYESSASLPETKQKRKLTPVLLLLAILIMGTLAFYWVYSKNNKNNFSKKTHDSRSSDSITINNSSDSSTTSSLDSLVTFKDKSVGETNTNPKTDTKKYTVVNKAWFYYEPDSNKIKPVYLMPRKNLVVTSRKEENGFVYIVYINSKGESTHGWLAKKDLHPVE